MITILQFLSYTGAAQANALFSDRARALQALDNCIKAPGPHQIIDDYGVVFFFDSSKGMFVLTDQEKNQKVMADMNRAWTPNKPSTILPGLNPGRAGFQ